MGGQVAHNHVQGHLAVTRVDFGAGPALGLEALGTNLLNGIRLALVVKVPVPLVGDGTFVRQFS